VCDRETDGQTDYSNRTDKSTEGSRLQCCTVKALCGCIVNRRQIWPTNDRHAIHAILLKNSVTVDIIAASSYRDAAANWQSRPTFMSMVNGRRRSVHTTYGPSLLYPAELHTKRDVRSTTPTHSMHSNGKTKQPLQRYNALLH